MREQIDSLNPRDIAALLNYMPQLRVSPNRDRQNRLSTPRCPSMGGRQLRLWFNGVPIDDTMAINEILDHTAPSMIQAVEVYNGATNVPPNFQPACGAVLIWTRTG